MKKEFIDTHTVKKNAFFLAEKIYNDDFIPSIIYVSLRGGAILGNIISEYFKLSTHPASPPIYGAVVIHSYSGVKETKNITIDGWTYPPNKLRRHDKVLLIDDIFDSGRTINKLCEILEEQGVVRENLKIAVHDYKIHQFIQSEHLFTPDYYCRKIEILTPEEDSWIHYLSHELEGLTEKEIETNYDSTLQTPIKTLIQRREAKLKKHSY